MKSTLTRPTGTLSRQRERGGSQIPSKTFLVGEYLALFGGPSLILCTEPSFSLTRNPTADSPIGFPPGSPAYRYAQDHPELFENQTLEFHDPHGGKGGFGASTAQFGFLYQIINPGPINYAALVKEYQHYASYKSGIAPSGADLVAQLTGGICYFDASESCVESLSWPFSAVTISLFRTNTKIPTHEHLAELDHLNLQRVDKLRTAVQQVREGLISATLENVVSGVHLARAHLQAEHLTTQSTTHMLTELDKIPGILACKGCGALGADVILVIHSLEVSENLIAQAENLGCNYSAKMLNSYPEYTPAPAKP